MLNFISAIETKFYKFRDALWNFPDYLWFGESSFKAKFHRVYLLSRPFSHFVFSVVLTFAVLIMAVSSHNVLFAETKQKLIEGVVMGIDDRGFLQKLSKVSPLVPTSIQLEKDLSELIYEPLLRINADGSPNLVLAQSMIRIEEGADYEFQLRPDVKWHDGQPFTVEDVERTMQIVSQLTKTDISYVQAIKQMAWEKTGPNSIRICTTSEALQATIPAGSPLKCSGVRGDKPILSNFLELISIKIIPAHLANDINDLTINRPEPLLNRFPIGTGKYKFQGAGESDITLSRNEDYYGVKPSIQTVEFKMFRSEDAAMQALENGEIHTLATTSTQYIRAISSYDRITKTESPVLQNQYWALYFNLRKDLNDNPIGPAFFQDVNVRRAIAAGINRDRVLQTLSGVGAEAKGPIYTGSEFFNTDAGWYTYDPGRADNILSQAGWIRDPVTRIRTKDGVKLSFKLTYVDNEDRNKVVESIRQDLLELGVEVIPDPKSLKELTNEVVTVKVFDMLLYGMSTFIDPDRFELFHSGEGLNLASYVGSEETVKIENQKKINLPRVDRLLEQGRSYNPLDAKDARKSAYDRLQELIAADSPVVFLYHPQFVYYVNKRVESMDLSGVNSIEQRFLNIARWKIN
jgi:peptide/nickel transport system substrate-binding protein